MTIIEAIILGILQGLSEFLPISSTAHLTLAGHFMGLIDPSNTEKWTAFIAVVQMGTLFAVLFYFYNELKSISTTMFKENIGSNRIAFRNQSFNSKMGWYIIVGSIPIFVIGYLLKKLIEGGITKDPLVIASSLIILAVFLYVAEKRGKLFKKFESISFSDSLLIGLAQCLALIPGASRSGTTLTAGMFLGIDRAAAARFSFLLSIPAVLVSGVYEFYKSLPYMSNQEYLALIIAVSAAFLSGYATIAFLIKFLQTKTTMIFISYRIVLGLIIIILHLFNVL